MQITAEQLKPHLDKLKPSSSTPVPTVYLIYGGEPQQSFSAKTTLIKFLQQHGFNQRKSFAIDEAEFNWEQLQQFGSNLSLFADKQIIELDIKQGKLGTQGAASLISFIETTAKSAAFTDVCLILTAGKIDNNVMQSKWFTAINRYGCVVIAKPILGHNFAKYVASQFKESGFSLEQDTIAHLSAGYSGNTIALAQLLEKLKLCFTAGKLSLQDISPCLHLEGDFSVFELMDATVARNNQNICEILSTLKKNKIDPILIIWAFIREVRALINIHYLTQNGTPFTEACKLTGIWISKAPAVRNLLTTTPIATLEKLLQSSLKADMVVKNIFPGLIWETLLNLCLKLANNDILLDLENNSLCQY